MGIRFHKGRRCIRRRLISCIGIRSVYFFKMQKISLCGFNRQLNIAASSAVLAEDAVYVGVVDNG